MNPKEQLAGLVEKWRATASDEIGMAYSGPWEACADDLAAILATLPEPGVVYGWVLGDAFVEARHWTADAPPENWTPVYLAPAAPAGEVDDSGEFKRGWQAGHAAALYGKPAPAGQGVDAEVVMQDIADAAAALDKRGDRQMATRLMRRHDALAAAAKGVGRG